MFFHQVAGPGVFPVFIGFKNLRMHMVNFFLSIRSGLINIGKNRKLAAKCLGSSFQFPVIAVVIKNKMKIIGVSDPERDRKHIVIHQENGQPVTREVPLDFFGNLEEEYEKRNERYIREEESSRE